MDYMLDCVRVTRGIRKRVATNSFLEQSDAKKRVVFRELFNLEVEKKKKKTSDIDAKSDDPQMCGAYVSDIHSYLHQMEMEPRRIAVPNYIDRVQKDVTVNMRGVLVDWLVEVSDEYELRSETLYLTVSYIDRYLSVNAVNRQKLQLLGVSCMLIAAKYEEISPPTVDDFCYITDNTCSKNEVVKMEAAVLKSLNFELGNPTAKTFLGKFTRIAQEKFKTPNLKLEFLSCFLADLSLLDYSCVKFPPSLVAASVVFLSNFTLWPKLHPWNLTLQECSGYTPADLKSCVLVIQDLQLSKRGGTLAAIRNKYKQHKFHTVSKLSLLPEIPASYFEDC
ncbi:unnamed protein product [Rhodiola kirilowii]